MATRSWHLVLILVFTTLLQGCDSSLYTNLSEREANKMVAALLRDGIAAQRKVQDDGMMTVTVPQDRLSQAVTLLDDIGLPEQKFSNMGDVFKGNGLVSSPVQERAQMVYALSEELSHTVSQIDGVLSARVHVVLPDNDLLKRVISPSSASVLIRYEANTDVDKLVPQIKALVANSVSGLGYDGVSVTAVKAVVRSQDSTPPLKSFLGLWMLEASVARAKVMLFSGLVLLLGMAGAIAWHFWRQRVTPGIYVLKESE
ncbi:EscJ/YscJ/HrcJ family type III secretion inner membrane ring protein [Stutzerimonas zhaodongensis]|uniref:Lipoprotein n=1 Tax=Stutzerimonas zhaodongensis TaxID=1176257 RepID=A0A3M2HSG8_9GAMM|nr:type III secretion inner membrane ring lipoprotein SctJ [Stutzerimonas zhaodongensis]MCQ2028422.1 type III secretion inner membrane ring lipoprotein SctJ [Stutzerimonas zhaodongensis]MCQ4317382.1 type III secretion inner membrane ring lipoprotein SctJ [Stutzerimonas zhaodongensis]RMH89862.1 EscJ/YscJ/HrcJ family type III secretion inner membrane ring protein [Stutzerimonas zhaodongensis]